MYAHRLCATALFCTAAAVGHSWYWSYTGCLSSVRVEGCYWKATLLKSLYSDTYVYSDRIMYAAYAECCEPSTILKGLHREQLLTMNLRKFCECVHHRFVCHTDTELTKLGKRGKLKSCEKESGHWTLNKAKRQSHVRFSTILNTDLAANYQSTELDTQTHTTLSLTCLLINVDNW